MKRFGNLPLVHQPGERWMYHSGSDILGVLIARVTGRSLEAFLRERIFDPLGMKDTAFSAPAAKVDRLATSYRTDGATGGLALFDEARGGRFTRPPTFESGGGGLVSTVDDYLAFGRMMLSNGKAGSERILSRLSVELMTTNHITPAQKVASEFFPGFWDNRGWGFGLSIVTTRDDVAAVPGRYGWDGGYGMSWYSDPKEDMTAILMTQRVWDPPTRPPSISTSGPRHTERSTIDGASAPSDPSPSVVHPIVANAQSYRMPRRSGRYAAWWLARR
jgi:CubicO group peptidase (beta-lactamase class C family)